MKESDIKTIKTQNAVIITLLIFIFIVLIIGVSSITNSNTKTSDTETESEYNTTYDVSMFKEISANDIKTVTKKSIQVIYIGRESCGWCAAFLPNLWDAQEEYDYVTQYIDISKIIDYSTGDIIDESSYEILSNLTGDDYEGYMESNLGSTPMILIMKNNKIIKAQTGYSEYDTFVSLLNEAGIK